jgi:dienelactone hydrolase
MDEADRVGHTVSHYRVTERLGGGGMGIVYKAVDTRLNRFVALKFLSASLTKDPEAKERFIHEAQAASALDHPNICTIHEIDETPDQELFLTMAYYEGETLKHRIERGPVPVDEAVDIALQVAQALSRAHESGIVHRDIKPANLMLPKDGPVKIVDFGLAKLVGHSELTKTGTTVGTVAYMAPEQIRGAEAGPAADVWGVGVVLYQMLSGTRPFEGKDDLAIVSKILDEAPQPLAAARPGLPDALLRIVARALDKNVAHRYPTATELLADLKAYQAAMAPGRAASTTFAQVLRRPVVAAGIAAVLVAVSVPVVLAYRRSSRTRWARDEGIPQIMQLVAKDDYAGAFALAKEVERYSPGDPVLANLWTQFSNEASLNTNPDGADVYVQPYAETGDAWTSLGPTPVKSQRLARGVFRIKVVKAGFEPLVLASMNPGAVLGNLGGPRRPVPITMTLVPSGKSPEMVPVPGGAYPVGLSGFNSEVSVSLDSFLIDRDEVTNQAFKQFIDRGGYVKAEYWQGLAAPASRLVDSTGRPGPAAWELGAYPAGQADYPVGGVSWYEAVAFCRSEGKVLPPIFHWARAALSPVEIGSPLAPSIIPLSNFGGKGPAAVGSARATGPYGTRDMAGNVREWVWNETADGRRWILGGAWGDPGYLFVVPNSLPADDRAASNGFRCARFGDGVAIPDRLLARVDTFSRDYRTTKAVSDEVFDVFKRQMAYVKAPLNARVESRDTSQPDRVREKITFDAGYENTRVSAYLFLPAGGGPHQLVVVFPGVPIGPGSSANTQPTPAYDYIIKSGRAVVLPIYKGYLERWDPFLSLQGEEYQRTFRARMAQWRQDLGNVLDALSMRPDIDATRIAYLGLSFGGSTAFPLIALEDRLKTAVLAPSGFTYRLMPPEADALNYVSRVKIPVLMLGGRHDYIFPLETAQKPMFEWLGTPAEHKRHVVFDAGHTNFPRSEQIREVLGWLDRYLGPVKSTNP